MRLVELARAKVNLSLRVLGRRPDGYHELDSVVAFADVGDLLTLEPSDRFELVAPGLDVPGSDNLVAMAVEAYGRLAGKGQNYRVALDKRLPVAAGIGGGSADAAAALRLLVRAATDAGEPPLPMEALMELAASLGSDVPVCLASRLSRMTGRGDIVQRIAAADVSWPAVLVNARHPVPARKTAEIFGRLAAPALVHPTRTLGDDRVTERLGDAVNDLEAPALAVMPVVADVLAALRATAGLTAARMSGAGPTCFGLYVSAAAADEARASILARHLSWWVVATTLR